MHVDASTVISSLSLNLSLSLDALIRAVVGILSITCVSHQHVVRLRICKRRGLRAMDVHYKPRIFTYPVGLG